LLKSSIAAPDSAGIVEMENGLAYGKSGFYFSIL